MPEIDTMYNWALEFEDNQIAEAKHDLFDATFEDDYR